MLFQIFYHDLAAFVGTGNRIPIYIGETKVSVVMEHTEGRDGVLFINLHRDEQSSLEAGKKVLRDGGTLVELKVDGQGNRREIEFTLGGRKYSFDPNRMFSDGGIWNALKVFGKNGIWHGVLNGKKEHQKAFDAVQTFREKLLEGLDLAAQSYGLEKIVALHNNSPGGGLSINSYLPGGSFATDAEKVHVGEKKSPDDFFLVTKNKDFEKLMGKGYNVVLQSSKAKNDGSLSVYIAKNRPELDYLNCEAAPGTDKQVRMLKDALD